MRERAFVTFDQPVLRRLGCAHDRMLLQNGPAMMTKRPGIKMDPNRRVASVVAASSQRDVEDAEMQATPESLPLKCV